MSENLRKYIKGVYLLDAVAQRVPAAAWDSPSCCDGWTARQVAGHAGWLIKNLGSIASGSGPIDAQPEAEVLGEDPARELSSIVESTLAALDRPGVLATVAATPFGEMPIDNFLGIVWVDPMTHAWDVADAAAIAHGIDAESAIAGMAQLQPLSAAIRGPGMFGDATAAATDDPVAAFIAFTGRTSVRS